MNRLHIPAICTLVAGLCFLAAGACRSTIGLLAGIGLLVLSVVKFAWASTLNNNSTNEAKSHQDEPVHRHIPDAGEDERIEREAAEALGLSGAVTNSYPHLLKVALQSSLSK
jgi:hypothetical protein